MKRAALLVVLAVVFIAPLGAETIQILTRPEWDGLVPGATTIGFEGIAPAGGYIEYAAPLALDGVTFAHVGASRMYMILISGMYPSGSYDRGSGDSLQIGAQDYSGANSLLRATLPGGTLAVAADLYSVGASASNLPAAVSIVLSTGETYLVMTPSNSETMSFFGVVSSTPIAYVDFAANADQSAYLNVDNVSFGSQVVPEPSAILLALGALLLVGSLRYRRPARSR
jgi:hypothetical protein